MVGIVRGFFNDPDEAMQWLVTRPPPATAAIDRSVTQRAIRLATDPTALLSLPGWHADIDQAWADRAGALARYRTGLPPEMNTGRVVESLLHMHHNRLIGIDRDNERACRRLARNAALAWQHRPGGAR
jgi:thiopeptide-type bacteriocin biosynthesis protein